VDWNIIFAIGSIGSLIVTFYRWVYCRHKDKVAKEREEIYKPLREDVQALTDSVKNFENERCEQPPVFWKTIEGKVSSKFYGRLEELFEKKFGEYCNWLKASEALIRYKIYFYMGTHLRGLGEEFKNLGVGVLEYKLYGSLLLPILRGESMSPSWFKEHDPSLYEEIEKCPRSKDIRSLLNWLNEREPCIETLRRIRHDLMGQAEKVKNEVNRKIRG